MAAATALNATALIARPSTASSSSQKLSSYEQLSLAPRASSFAGVSLRSDGGARAQRATRFSATRVQAVAAPQKTSVSSPLAKEAAKPSKTQSLAIVTGASSGLGLSTTKALTSTGEWHVVMACRDFVKAEKAAKRAGLPEGSYTVMHLDLGSLNSVRQFVENFRAKFGDQPLSSLVCNAAVYFPTAKEPTFTADGFEESVGVNHLGHFLLARLLLDDLKEAKSKVKQTPRLIIVGSVTGNTNTLAGNVPPKANLGDLSGLAKGLDGKDALMIDAGEFDGAKAYKDSKVCNMLTMGEFHRRFHEDTGIVFSSLYPGCIAETGLFRSHYQLFRTLFPPFQKYITKGYVSEEDAGKRLAQVVKDPALSNSGVYWSWDGKSGSFVNELSEEASDAEKAKKLWEISEKLVGLA